MRYQWITRLLGNPLVVSDEIMEPFAREVLEQASALGNAVVLILDQSKFSDRHQVLMLALRFGERAVPLAWRIEATEGAIGFETQKALLAAVAPWLPEGARVRLMGDRFYGTANLIGWCQERAWDYRLRLKGNLTVFDGAKTTAACAEKRTFYLEDVELTARRVRTHIGIIHDPGHPEPWIIAMSERPGYLRTLDYGQRWGIEPMFSDFKSRGFGIPRSASLTAWIASSWSWPSPSTGRSPQDSGMRSTMPLPAKKKRSRSTQESGPQPNLLVHQGPPPHRQDRPILPAAPAPLGGAAKLMDGKLATRGRTQP